MTAEGGELGVVFGGNSGKGVELGTVVRGDQVDLMEKVPAQGGSLGMGTDLRAAEGGST